MESIQPVSFTHVDIRDAFWSPRMEVNRTVTLPAQLKMLETTGRIDAFRLDWKEGRPNKPHPFWDSDVAKWVEAASYTLATHPDAVLADKVEEVVGVIASCQQADGYLNAHFQSVRPNERWTNLRDNHDLYCAGHLMEAAVAHHAATGQRMLIDALSRYADHIGRLFGTGPGQKRGYGGHPEIELALVRLAEETGQRKYLDLSRYFIDERGRREPHFYEEEARARGEEVRPGTEWSYSQSHLPVRDQKEVVGHAVRAFYLYSGMADIAREYNDAALLAACKALWQHATGRMLYLTGGVGSSKSNEGFTADFDLPNDTAYAETCAGIALIFFAHRMLHLDVDGQYADVLERALYNNVLAGVSSGGDRFFYDNPLASHGQHDRPAWFSCACCPPNLSRLLASLGGYAFSTSPAALWVHLYMGSAIKTQVAGHDVNLTVDTRYPWEGAVELTVSPAAPVQFDLKLRIPGWCRSFEVSVAGEVQTVAVEKGYITISRDWKNGDKVRLSLAMPVERVYPNPRIRQDAGRVALQRGPIVYCLEQADNGAGIERISLRDDASITATERPDLLGGVVALSAAGETIVDAGNKALYSTEVPRLQPISLTAIPYYAWNNRGRGDMAVWIRRGPISRRGSI
jgi:DUF1680 family protein